MRSGRFRHRVAIERNEPTQDAYGDDVDEWRKVADWWADVQPMRAGEIVEASRFRGRVTHKLTMRYYAGLESGHRIVFGDRILNIDGVVNVGERNKYDEVLAVEDV